MQKIDSILVGYEGRARTISFWLGNPAEITVADPVDLIIVSAFPHNYTPTPRSIIGALHRRGLSVARLAEHKAFDLRETTGFWLSQPMVLEATPVGVSRILCFEPHFLGSHPAEVVGKLFRGLFPFLRDDHETKIAMAVIATGALRENPERMLRALVSAASGWMKRGLPVSELRIMEQNPERADALARTFAEMKDTRAPDTKTMEVGRYDLFLSFAAEDGDPVDIVRNALRATNSNVRLFDYRHSIETGKVWQDAIDLAMQSCRKMVAFISPWYFKSVECKEELNMARLRHKRERQSFLFPLYVRSLCSESELPLWLQAITYDDCREANETKLVAAADRLAAIQDQE
jgi:hypothetical protein